MLRKISFMLLAFSLLLAPSCSNLGKKVKDPFSGNKYQSNNRFWRSTGFGSSKDQQIARQKAMLEARKNIASEISTNMRAVADQYMKSAEINDKEESLKSFESLYREVLDQNIADVRVHDQKSFKQEDGSLNTYVAMEVRKKHMYRHMKRLAEARSYSSPAQKTAVMNMLNEELKRLEMEDPD